MIQYEKMLYEILINYIPKISGSLEDIVIELKRLNSLAILFVNYLMDY